ncbi:MAG: hypothetical protein BZ136_08800 [Methanosphaera sp. rholeuAM74]|nr:MAG: hypothetical protein BZ136_08800 [Methanosphaera sp. rholeuAM74]
MNENKIIFSFVMLVTLLIMINAISATQDVKDVTDITSDNIKQDIKTAKNHELYVTSTGSGDGLSEENPTTLTQALKSAEDDTTINLVTQKQSDTYNDEREYNLRDALPTTTKTITIRGQEGKTITFKDAIFIKDLKVNLENIKFQGQNTYIVSIDSDLTLDHTNFTNAGNADYGILYASGGNMTITNSEFENSSLFTSENYNLTLENNTFINGVTMELNAAYNQVHNNTFKNFRQTPVHTYHSNLDYNMGYYKITSNTFTNNTDNSFSSSIHTYNGNMTLANNTFTQNTAPYGQVYISANETEKTLVTIDSNTFKDNNATNGGAIYIEGKENATLTVNIKNNKIINNNATNATAIYIKDMAMVVLESNTYINNTDNQTDNLITADQNNTKNIRANNNTYTSNYLETKLNHTWLNDSTLKVDMAIRSIYNDTVRSGTLTLYVDGEENQKQEVTNGTIAIDVDADLTIQHTLQLAYTCEDKSYQPLLTEEFQSRIVEENTTTPLVNTEIQLEVSNTTPIINTPVNITTTLVDANYVLLANQEITLKVGSQTYNIKTNDEGVATQAYTPTTTGKLVITATYQQTDDYNSSNNTVTINVKDKINTNITVSTVYGVIANPLTFTANVTDTDNKAVTNGYVIFKLNGITIKDNKKLEGSTNPLKVYVKDGIATTTVTADLNMRYAQNLTAVYSGSSTYNASRSNNAKAQIRQRNASIVVTSNVKSIKQGQVLTITARVYDTTIGKRSTTLVPYEDEFVYFKVNGITIKDSKGNMQKVKLVNGVATINYTIPLGLSGVTDGKTFNVKNHTILAGYYNKNYQAEVRNTSTFQVERSNITITISNVTVNNRTHKLSLTATIKDYLGNKVLGPNKCVVKVNGATLKNGTKPIYYFANNGVLSIKDVTIPAYNNYKTIEIVTQDRLSYKSQRNTTNVIKVLN